MARWLGGQKIQMSGWHNWLPTTRWEESLNTADSSPDERWFFQHDDALPLLGLLIAWRSTFKRRAAQLALYDTNSGGILARYHALPSCTPARWWLPLNLSRGLYLSSGAGAGNTHLADAGASLGDLQALG